MDVSDFLNKPLIARLAVSGPNGPTVRPVWFLFEDGTFWWLTGSSYSRLEALLEADARVSLVIDTCDLVTGQVLALTVSGVAEVHPFDRHRAIRKLSKYLGAEQYGWPERFREALTDPTTRMVSLRPNRQLKLRNLSYQPSGT